MGAIESLYMFAIMPPKDVTEKIQAERIAFAQKYDCHKALKPPVHITLYPPFSAMPAIEEQAESLGRWASAQRSFIIDAHNYNYFKRSRSPVIYIDIKPNAVLASFHTAFVQQLQQFMHAETSGSYKPHFTIGYRDVPLRRFAEIKDEYSKRVFSASFQVSSFFLWKHDRQKWNILKEFQLNAR